MISVWLVALYGSKTWTLKATNVNKLTSFKTICYRQAPYISWTDDKSNESVLEEMGMQRQFIVTIRKRKLQYFGHNIMVQNLCTHILEEEHIDGRRSRRRPKQSWIDDRDQTEKMPAEFMIIAREGRQWKALVHLSLVPNPQQFRWERSKKKYK